MTTAGFNLLDERWIDVIDNQGRPATVSILELLCTAHTLSALAGDLPTQDFVITRLLLAFVHRALDGPRDQQDWAQLWEADRLPAEPLADYAGRVRSRFNLFDPAAPFFQVGDLTTATGPKPVSLMMPMMRTGATLFTDRSARNLRQISAAEAARWLVHVHAFDPAGNKSAALGDTHPGTRKGKGYAPGVAHAAALGCLLLRGENLRETLLLNLIGRTNPQIRIGGPDDIPPWERDPDTALRVDRQARGAIDLYTWQSRRVRLIGDPTAVTGVLLTAGDKLDTPSGRPTNLHTVEPHTAWKVQKNATTGVVQYRPIAHPPERSVWRGLASLLPPTAPFPPPVLSWVADLVAHGWLAETFSPRLAAYGMSFDDHNTYTRHLTADEMPLPVALLNTEHPAAGAAAVEAAADAENVAAALTDLATNIARAASNDPGKSTPSAAGEDLYAALDGPYRRWVSQLGPATDLAAARQEWQHIVGRAAHTAAAAVIAAAPTAAWIGRSVHNRGATAPGHRSVADADSRFRRRLNTILPLAHPNKESA